MSLWSKRLRELAKHTNVLLINVFGVSGSGKTNLALFLTTLLKDIYDHHYYVVVEDTEDIRNLTTQNSLIVFEDFTYLAHRHTTQIDSFLRELMLIRHKLKHACLIIITHYTTSILPVLRLSHVRALTSLTTVSEIKKLKEYFNPSALWDYYETYLKRYNEYWSLLNILGYHIIVRSPLTPLYLKLQNKTMTPMIDLTPYLKTETQKQAV